MGVTDTILINGLSWDLQYRSKPPDLRPFLQPVGFWGSICLTRL